MMQFVGLYTSYANCVLSLKWVREPSPHKWFTLVFRSADDLSSVSCVNQSHFGSDPQLPVIKITVHRLAAKLPDQNPHIY
jgi:hypothetical protein